MKSQPEKPDVCSVHEQMMDIFDRQISVFEKKLDENSLKLDKALELLYKGSETTAMQAVIITQIQKDLDLEREARTQLTVDMQQRFQSLSRIVWMGVGAASLCSILLPIILTLLVNWERFMR